MTLCIAEIILVLFRFINFGILLGLIGYVFKKHMLSGIIKQMAEQRSILAGLEKSGLSLRRQQAALHQAAKQELELQDTLKEKLHDWRAVIDTERIRMEQERDTRKALLEKSMESRQREIENALLMRRVGAQVIAEARMVLMERFRDEGRQAQLNRKILADIARVKGGSWN